MTVRNDTEEMKTVAPGAGRATAHCEIWVSRKVSVDRSHTLAARRHGHIFILYIFKRVNFFKFIYFANFSVKEVLWTWISRMRKLLNYRFPRVHCHIHSPPTCLTLVVNEYTFSNKWGMYFLLVTKLGFLSAMLLKKMSPLQAVSSSREGTVSLCSLLCPQDPAQYVA